MAKKIGILLLTIIIGALAVAYIYLNTITKNVIENYGTKITGTGVSVGFVSVSPFSGKISIHNLTVKSPNGFKADHVLKIGSLKSEVVMSSALSDIIIIKSLKIDEPEIIHELSMGGYNIEAIKRSASKPSSGSG